MMRHVHWHKVWHDRLLADAEFHGLIPKLSPAEYAQLEANIKSDGCRDPLVVWKDKGLLLDGHNRKQICEQHGLPYKTTELDFKTRADAKGWIIRNQFGRRNLTPYQRAELALKLKPLIAAKAKEQQKRKPKSVPQKSAKQKPTDTRQELAETAGVSHDTIHKVQVIAAHADDETKERLRRAELSIHAVYKSLTTPHVTKATGENEWYTPLEYIQAARKVMGAIDCDPASSEIANRTVKAAKFYTQKQDGLTQVWGKRVYCNPPYSQPLIRLFSEALVSRLESGEVEQACVLVNNATETEWFQIMLAVVVAACFVKGRVRFLDPDGKPGAPLQGQVVLYMGENIDTFKAAFGKMGVAVRLQRGACLLESAKARDTGRREEGGRL